MLAQLVPTFCHNPQNKAHLRQPKLSESLFMSFVPVPQQANAAGANSNNAVKTDPAAAVEPTDAEHLFKIRTFDVFWVDKKGE
jgi:hypothetical protein